MFGTARRCISLIFRIGAVEPFHPVEYNAKDVFEAKSRYGLLDSLGWCASGPDHQKTRFRSLLQRDSDRQWADRRSIDQKPFELRRELSQQLSYGGALQ